MVYQQFINYPNFTVFENIASPLRVARMTARRDRRARAPHRRAAAAHADAASAARPSCRAASSSAPRWRARWSRTPSLVLLDEPLANLDFKLREELRDELPKLFADRRCTVVFATSDPIEALLLGGHTATLHEGRITQFGPTAEVYRRPVDLRDRAGLLQPADQYRAGRQAGRQHRAERQRAVGRRAAMRQRPDGRYTVGIRPHHIGLVRERTRRARRSSGKVLIAELSGSESVIHFAHGALSWVSQSHGVHAIEVGATAQVLYRCRRNACISTPTESWSRHERRAMDWRRMTRHGDEPAGTAIAAQAAATPTTGR